MTTKTIYIHVCDLPHPNSTKEEHSLPDIKICYSTEIDANLSINGESFFSDEEKQQNQANLHDITWFANKQNLNTFLQALTPTESINNKEIAYDISKKGFDKNIKNQTEKTKQNNIKKIKATFTEHLVIRELTDRIKTLIEEKQTTKLKWSSHILDTGDNYPEVPVYFKVDLRRYPDYSEIDTNKLLETFENRRQLQIVTPTKIKKENISSVIEKPWCNLKLVHDKIEDNYELYLAPSSKQSFYEDISEFLDKEQEEITKTKSSKLCEELIDKYFIKKKWGYRKGSTYLTFIPNDNSIDLTKEIDTLNKTNTLPHLISFIKTKNKNGQYRLSLKFFEQNEAWLNFFHERACKELVQFTEMAERTVTFYLELNNQNYLPLRIYTDDSLDDVILKKNFLTNEEKSTLESIKDPHLFIEKKYQYYYFIKKLTERFDTVEITLIENSLLTFSIKFIQNNFPTSIDLNISNLKEIKSDKTSNTWLLCFDNKNAAQIFSSANYLFNKILLLKKLEFDEYQHQKKIESLQIPRRFSTRINPLITNYIQKGWEYKKEENEGNAYYHFFPKHSHNAKTITETFNSLKKEAPEAEEYFTIHDETNPDGRNGFKLILKTEDLIAFFDKYIEKARKIHVKSTTVENTIHNSNPVKEENKIMPTTVYVHIVTENKTILLLPLSLDDKIAKDFNGETFLETYASSNKENEKPVEKIKNAVKTLINAYPGLLDYFVQQSFTNNAFGYVLPIRNFLDFTSNILLNNLSQNSANTKELIDIQNTLHLAIKALESFANNQHTNQETQEEQKSTTSQIDVKTENSDIPDVITSIKIENNQGEINFTFPEGFSKLNKELIKAITSYYTGTFKHIDDFIKLYCNQEGKLLTNTDFAMDIINYVIKQDKNLESLKQTLKLNPENQKNNKKNEPQEQEKITFTFLPFLKEPFVIGIPSDYPAVDAKELSACVFSNQALQQLFKIHVEETEEEKIEEVQISEEVQETEEEKIEEVQISEEVQETEEEKSKYQFKVIPVNKLTVNGNLRSKEYQIFREIKFNIVDEPIDTSYSNDLTFSLTADEFFVLENHVLWFDGFLKNIETTLPWKTFQNYIKQNYDIVSQKNYKGNTDAFFENQLWDNIKKIIVLHPDNYEKPNMGSDSKTLYIEIKDVKNLNKKISTLDKSIKILKEENDPQNDSTIESIGKTKEKFTTTIANINNGIEEINKLINAIKNIAKTYNRLKTDIESKDNPLLKKHLNEGFSYKRDGGVITSRENKLPFLYMPEGISCDNKEIDFRYAFVVLLNEKQVGDLVKNWIEQRFENLSKFEDALSYLTFKQIALSIDKHLVGWAIQFPKKLFDRFLKPSESDFLSPIKIYSKTHETGDGSMFNKRKTRTMKFLVPTKLDAGDDKGFQSFLEQLYEGEEKQKTLYTQIEQAMECEFKNEVEKDFIPYLQNAKNSGKTAETAVIIPKEMLKQIYIITQIHPWLQKTEKDDNTSVLPSEFYSYRRSDKKLVLATRIIDTKKDGSLTIDKQLENTQKSILGDSPVPEDEKDVISFEITQRGKENRFYRIHILINEDCLKTILNAHPSIKDYSTVKAEDDKMLAEFAKNPVTGSIPKNSY